LDEFGRCVEFEHVDNTAMFGCALSATKHHS